MTEINRDGYITGRLFLLYMRQNATKTQRSCRIELKRPDSIFSYYTRYVSFFFHFIQPTICFYFANKCNELDTLLRANSTEKTRCGLQRVNFNSANKLSKTTDTLKGIDRDIVMRHRMIHDVIKYSPAIRAVAAGLI